MAANSNRIRGALLGSTALIAGVGGSLSIAPIAFAQNILPTSGVVTSGAASIRQSGADLSIVQTSPRAIVNWGSFSVGQSNGVTFDQPSASSTILNRVTGSARSSIAGQLQANGQVYLVNPNGIAITPTGAVQVGGGFVASTLGIADRDFNSGNLRFTGNGASAGVSNAGSIEAGPGAFVGLIGGTVANSGVVSVPLGKVGIGSGEQATLNLTGDNFLQVAVPTNAKTADGKALIDVSGKVVAAGGRVELRAATVAQAIRNAVNVPGSLSVASARAAGGSIILSGGAGGDVSATGRLSAAGRTRGGAIALNGHNVALRHARLVASSAKGNGGSATVTGTNAVSLASTSVDASGATGGGAIRIGGDFHGARDIVSAKTTTVDSGSTLNASATGSGNGGTVAVWSETATGFAGKITATGGPKDGNGGYVEISADPGAHGVLDFIGSASLTAAKGTTGTLLLDPYNITISTGTDGGGSFSGGNTNNWNPTATSVINNVTLENQLAISNVIISTGLAGSPGTDAGNLTVLAPVSWSTASNLTLTAFNNLTIGARISATAGGGLTLNGGASVNIDSPISTTTGSIAVTSGSVVANSPTVLDANLTTSAGVITFNDAVQLAGNVTLNTTLNAGSGFAPVTFKSTIDSAPASPLTDLTVIAGNIFLEGALGGTNPLGAVSLTQTVGTLSVPSITATGDIKLTGGAAVSPISPIELTGNISTSGGGVSFTNAVSLESPVTISAPKGTTTFASTVDTTAFSSSCAGACDLTVSTSTISFGDTLGGINPLGAVVLTSTNGMTLPSITATTIVAQTTGASADLTLGPGTILTAFGAGTAVTLGAGRAFINDSGNGSGTIVFETEEDPRWLVYLSNPAIDPAIDPAIVVPGGLNSGATAVWDTPFGGAVAAAGDRYVFAFQPAITVTSGNLGKTYGQDVTSLVAADYTISGVEPGIPGAFVGDTASAVYSGAPSVTSLGSPALASVEGSPYTITIGLGSLVIGDGYRFAANSAGLLSVSPLALTASLIGTVEKTYDGTTAATLTSGNYSLTGFIDAQSATVAEISGTYASPNAGSGIGVSATLAAGDFTAGPGTLLTNYVLPTSASGNVGQINPKPLTAALIGTVEKTYDGTTSATLNSGNYSLAGLVNAQSATVTQTSGTYASPNAGGGIGVSATLAAGDFTADSGTLLTNYVLPTSASGNVGLIDPRLLTFSVANAASTYGTTATLGAATLSGVLPGDTVVPTVGAFSGTTQVAIGPRTSVGTYSEDVTALSNPNYAIALSGNTPGTLTIDPLTVTYSVANASSIFGVTPILGPATLFGVLPGDAIVPAVGAFRGLAPVALTPFTPIGQYAELVTALSNPDYRIAPAPNFPGVLTITASTANPGGPSDPGFLPGLTQVNNPGQTESDVGGYEQVLPHFTLNCNEPPSLPDPNRYSDPDQALRAISQSMDNYFKQCQNPTQTTIANALDAYAAKLQILAPRLPPALRNVPAIVAEGARRVRAARSRTQAVAILHQTVAAIHKEIGLVLSEDPNTRSRELRDGDIVAGALDRTSVALVNSGAL